MPDFGTSRQRRTAAARREEYLELIAPLQADLDELQDCVDAIRNGVDGYVNTGPSANVDRAALAVMENASIGRDALERVIRHLGVELASRGVEKSLLAQAAHVARSTVYRWINDGAAPVDRRRKAPSAPRPATSWSSTQPRQPVPAMNTSAVDRLIPGSPSDSVVSIELYIPFTAKHHAAMMEELRLVIDDTLDDSADPPPIATDIPDEMFRAFRGAMGAIDNDSDTMEQFATPYAVEWMLREVIMDAALITDDPTAVVELSARDYIDYTDRYSVDSPLNRVIGMTPRWIDHRMLQLLGVDCAPESDALALPVIRL